MLTTYTSSASDGLIALNTALQESAAEVTALLPEDATENEQLFVDALESIQATSATASSPTRSPSGNRIPTRSTPPTAAGPS